MVNLVLDTSTKYLYIALVKDDVLLEELIFEGSKNHAGNSVYQIDLLLKKHNLTTNDLDNVYSLISLNFFLSLPLILE